VEQLLQFFPLRIQERHEIFFLWHRGSSSDEDFQPNERQFKERPSILWWRTTSVLALPNLITREGERTTKRFLEFFTANVRNKNTRLAYARSVSQFLLWCEQRNVTLTKIEPMIVAA
jgi:hypothetical protein